MGAALMARPCPQLTHVYVLSTFGLVNGWVHAENHEIFASLAAAKKSAVDSHGAALKWVERFSYGCTVQPQYYARHSRGGWYCITRRILYR